MAPVSNRFAKYIIQPDTAGGGSAPAPKANRFAKYKAGEAPAVQQANPMVAQGQAAQQAWRDGARFEVATAARGALVDGDLGVVERLQSQDQRA